MLLVGFSVIASELERPLPPRVDHPLAQPELAHLVDGRRSTACTQRCWWHELYFQLVGDHAARRGSPGIVSVVAAVAAQSNLGAVFGLAHARPAWYGPLLAGVLHRAGAHVRRGAAHPGRVGGGLLRQRRPPPSRARGSCWTRCGSCWRCSSAWSPSSPSGSDRRRLRRPPAQYEVTMASLTGPMFVSFWLFEVFLGLVVPLVLLLGVARHKTRRWPSRQRSRCWASSSCGTTCRLRADVLPQAAVRARAGELLSYSPSFKGNPAGFLSYTPSIVEVGVVIGAVAAGGAVCTSAAPAFSASTRRPTMTASPRPRSRSALRLSQEPKSSAEREPQLPRVPQSQSQSQPLQPDAIARAAARAVLELLRGGRRAGAGAPRLVRRHRPRPRRVGRGDSHGGAGGPEGRGVGARRHGARA